MVNSTGSSSSRAASHCIMDKKCTLTEPQIQEARILVRKRLDQMYSDYHNGLYKDYHKKAYANLNFNNLFFNMKQNWTSLIQKELGKSDKIPEGFYSIEEIAQLTGKSDSTTRRQMKQLVALGLVDVRSFKRKSASKTVHTLHYKIK